MNAKDHDRAGIYFGVVAGFFNATQANQSPDAALLEIVGAGIGGKLGAMLPDVLEPAIHSHHRDVCHSVVALLGIVTTSFERAPAIAAQCRAEADYHRALQAQLVDGAERIRCFVLEVVWRLAAGAVIGIAAGYASHLVLDAGTPRGIPLLKRGY